MAHDPSYRPSAAQQQRQSRRGLAIVAAVLVAVLAGSVGGLAFLVNSTNAQTFDGPQSEQAGDQTGDQSSEETPTVVDPEAPAETEPTDDATSDTTDDTTSDGETTETELPADERAASLALDPNYIQQDWAYNGVEENTVYLTFDDGPSANTEKVLDILDQYGVKATFFVTGHDPDYRGWIKEAYDRGHTIGMHTYSHDYATVYASVDAYFADLAQVAEVVKEQIGFVPYCIRFPGGTSNTISANYCAGIMTTLSQEVLARGYQYYDWNIGSADASGNTMPTETIVSSACQEGWRNPMILFHDSAPKTTTVEALPQIIEFYQSRGYKFAAITRDGFVSHHNAQN